MAIPFVKTSLLLMGVSGTIGQILLLRELLVSFLGNELTLGIILANWLVLESIGAFSIGKSVEKVKRRMEVFVLLQLIFSVAFPFAIYLSRIFKNLLFIPPGEGVGLIETFSLSFLILLPVSLSHGALFTYGCKIYNQSNRNEAASIGRVYVLETLGSILGGILTTFLMIPYLNSFEIAFIISLSNTFASIFLVWPKSLEPFISVRNGFWILSILFTFLYLCVLITPLSREIHFFSIQSQWKGLNAIHYENSIYGNITITKRGEQFTFYTDGVPSINTPIPDVASIEDFVHFPMLFHEKPQSILILSGGAGGMIYEILKYPVEQVDYVELDPLLLRLIQKYSTPLTQQELSNPKVKIHYTDGRFFLKRTLNHFDLIFIGLSAPQELQTNRLFSVEFFSIAREKMNPDGMIVFAFPGSMTYISPELKDLNGCIIDTVKKVFPFLKVIPGEVNLYLASNSEKILNVSPKDLIDRLEKRKIKTSLFNKSYIEFRLNPRWQDWFIQSMERKGGPINSDFRPICVSFNLSYWNALFSPYLVKPFKMIKQLSLKSMMVGIALLTLFLSILLIHKSNRSIHSIPYSIFTSGFTDMMLDLSIILTFQTLYGYLYFQIGLLVTTFMVGIAMGSFLITHYLDQIKRDNLLFLIIELLFIFFALSLPFALTLPSPHLEKESVYILLYGVFLFMSFICGVLVGLQFPLATKIYLRSQLEAPMVGYTAGLLYGADLLGGFLGGLLGGIFLLPTLGLKETCFLTAFIKGSSFLLFFIFMRIHPTKLSPQKGHGK